MIERILQVELPVTDLSRSVAWYQTLCSICGCGSRSSRTASSADPDGTVLLLGVAAELVARGHRVRFLTGARFGPFAEEAGSEFVALPEEADYDDRLLAAAAGERPSGIAGLRQDVAQAFLAAARAQYDALTALVMDGNRESAVVVADPTFLGAMLLAGHPVETRPLVVVAGVLPLPLSSSAVPPFGLGLQPWAGPLNRARNALLRPLVEKVVFGPVQRELEALYRSVHGRDAGAFVLDAMSTADAIVQFSVPAFEYPRPDARLPLRFAGPVLRSADTAVPAPTWWPDLDTAQPVVLATQGTIANTDFTELLRPTLDALAAEDLLVVVTTGGRPVEELGVLPGNARAAEFLPYDALFPHLDVLVTNGGYGGVRHALAHGVPLVVAGGTEDKPEVAARVSWSGTGVNSRTGRPKPRAVRDAVRRVLATEEHRAATAVVAEQIRASRGVDELVDVVAEVGRSPVEELA